MDNPGAAAVRGQGSARPDCIIHEMIVDIDAHLCRKTQLVVGVCGSQGSGKSTLVAALRGVLEARRLSVAVISLDDLYLTRTERQRLADEVHPLLRTRGVPGTHDVALGLNLLRQLKSASSDTTTALPRFDKTRYDRAPPEAWEVFQGRPDIIVLEGWCVAAQAQDAAVLLEPINDLEREHDREARWRTYVNDQLSGAYCDLFGALDYLVFLKVPAFDVVFSWRKEQEQKLQRDERGALPPMTDSQLRHFIAHYERLTRHMHAEMPSRADLVVALDRDRRVLDITRSSR